MSHASRIIRFYKNIQPPTGLPIGVGVLHPQADPVVMKTVSTFFKKFYSDTATRRFMMGINPGRFGAGITGINFTAPKQLSHDCKIPHSFGSSTELSAEFIYEVIQQYGGPAAFYQDHFIASVSPLGFVKDGKNLNYYDIPALQSALHPFITQCLDEQFAFGFLTHQCICIGGEKNYRYLSRINEERSKAAKPHFSSIIAVPHPRFIMQYHRKQKTQYIDTYLRALGND